MTAAHRKGFLLIPGIVVVLVVLTVRVAWSGADDLDTARQCAKIGLSDTAVNFYARAARWYLPFTSTSQDAIEGLVTLARGSSDRGDPETALKALREARGAILGTRWLFTPNGDYLPGINRDIARLMAATASPGGPGSDVDKNLEQLNGTTLPNPWLSLLATLMFVAWIPVTVVGAARSVTAQGRFAGSSAIPWIAVSAGLLFGWLVLVALA